MIFLSTVKDWFTDKSNPWYYIIGAAVLVVFIVLLAVYIALSNKKKKKMAQKAKDEQENVAANVDANADITETPNGAEEKSDGAETVQTEQPQTPAANEEEVTAEQDSIKKLSTEQADEQENKEESEQKVDSQESSAVEKAEEVKEPASPLTTQKKIKKDPVVEIASKAKTPPKTSPEKAATKTTPAKTAKSKTANKPFLDRLIADKANHGVYNEVKNTILSYTLIKAKLAAEEELFLNDKEKKAAIRLENGRLDLYLSLDPETAPQQLAVQKSNNAELPSVITVTSGNIDTAQKAIVFAMNVSMMVRSASHRTVDYINRAIEAKARAKNNAKKK